VFKRSVQLKTRSSIADRISSASSGLKPTGIRQEPGHTPTHGCGNGEAVVVFRLAFIAFRSQIPHISIATSKGLKKPLAFGAGWCHLAGDDFTQILTGAAPRLYWDNVVGCWKLVIEATMFVTYAVVNVWTGFKQAGNDPVGQYIRQAGCDPTATLTIEAQP